MFHCDRCDEDFSAATGTAAKRECPTCRERDDVAAPLRFRLFEPSALKVAGLRPGRRAAAPIREQVD